MYKYWKLRRKLIIKKQITCYNKCIKWTQARAKTWALTIEQAHELKINQLNSIIKQIRTQIQNLS